MKVPAGTPSTEPSGTKEKITAVARPTDSAARDGSPGLRRLTRSRR
jgi:hypothetical protein